MRKSLKIMLAGMLCAGVMTMGMNAEAAVQDKNVMQSAEKQGDRAIKVEKLKLVSEWDKTFPKSDKVDIAR